MGSRNRTSTSRREPPPQSPGPARAVATLHAELVEADRLGLLRLVRFEAQPQRWRTFAGPGGGRVSLRPDAFVVIRQGRYEDCWFIQVDQATEGISALARRCDAYRRFWQSGPEQVRSGIFPRVLIVVPDEHRYAVVVDVCGRQPAVAWPLFAVARTREAVTRIARGAHS